MKISIRLIIVLAATSAALSAQIKLPGAITKMLPGKAPAAADQGLGEVLILSLQRQNTNLPEQ